MVRTGASRGTVRALLFFALWLVIDQSAKPANLVVGVLASAAATWASLKLLPPARGRVRLGLLLLLLPRFLWQSLVAGVDVARRAFAPEPAAAAGLRRLSASSLPRGSARNAFELISSLLPGSVPSGETETRSRYHCLDTRQPVVEQLAVEERAYAAGAGAGAAPWMSSCSSAAAFVAADGGPGPGARGARPGRCRPHDGGAAAGHRRHRRAAAVRRGLRRRRGGRRGADAGAAGGLCLDRFRQVRVAQGPARPDDEAEEGADEHRCSTLFSIVAIVAGAVLLSRRHGRAAALSRCLHAAACADQGRQPGPGAGGHRPAAADGQRARGAEAGAGVAAGDAVQRRGVAADRARSVRRQERGE